MRTFVHAAKSAPMIGRISTGSPNASTIREAISTARSWPATSITAKLANTLDYVYELTGDRLTIWGGTKGSPPYFQGTFDAAGSTLAGAWTYPGGGGYASTMTRA
ncbi:hypothetical protein AB0F97_00325 [Nocardiopsis alba]|uniref:hypothetical protein n=1 Tax=Nocardiopsis alba TaxID=53437 RepID=UPI0033DA9FEA